MMVDVKHTTIKTLKFKLKFNFKVVLVFLGISQNGWVRCVLPATQWIRVDELKNMQNKIFNHQHIIKYGAIKQRTIQRHGRLTKSNK